MTYKRIKAEIKLLFHLIINFHNRVECTVSPPYGTGKTIGCWQCEKVYWDSSEVSEENKPREFWIRDQVKNFGLHEGARFVAFDSPLGVAYVDGSLHHVVEYKAYEKLQQELEIAVSDFNAKSEAYDQLVESYKNLQKQLSVDFQYQEIERLKSELSVAESQIEDLKSQIAYWENQ